MIVNGNALSGLSDMTAANQTTQNDSPAAAMQNFNEILEKLQNVMQQEKELDASNDLGAVGGGLNGSASPAGGAGAGESAAPEANASNLNGQSESPAEALQNFNNIFEKLQNVMQQEKALDASNDLGAVGGGLNTSASPTAGAGAGESVAPKANSSAGGGNSASLQLLEALVMLSELSNLGKEGTSASGMQGLQSLDKPKGIDPELNRPVSKETVGNNTAA